VHFSSGWLSSGVRMRTTVQLGDILISCAYINVMPWDKWWRGFSPSRTEET
jgi:hypothetical protein